MELMRLYSTDLRAASDTLLDLGTSSFRWKNLYLSGSATGLQASSATFVYGSSATFADVIATVMSSPTINASSMNTAIVKAFTIVSSPTISSSTTNALAFAGSLMVLNNGTNSCLNTPILLKPPPVMANGNFWFFSSSNLMYLAVRSSNVTYCVAMGT